VLRGLDKAQIPLGSTRLDTTRHVRRVEPMHFDCVELIEQHSLDWLDSLDKVERVESCRVESRRAKWNLGLNVRDVVAACSSSPCLFVSCEQQRSVKNSLNSLCLCRHLRSSVNGSVCDVNVIPLRRPNNHQPDEQYRDAACSGRPQAASDFSPDGPRRRRMAACSGGGGPCSRHERRAVSSGAGGRCRNGGTPSGGRDGDAEILL